MFDKIVRNTVTDQVIVQIKELLANGSLQPGDKLPSERQMADQMGVSRPSLREALRALEYAGVLKSQPNGGVYVSDGTSALENNLQVAHLLKQFALEEMIEVRRIIEAASVRFAVERGNKEALLAIRREHEASRRLIGDKAAFALSDFEFHRAIAEAAGNDILVTMLQTMRQMMRDFNIQLLSTTEGREEVFAHHQAILDAIENHDADAAVDALINHLDNVVRTMKSSTPKK